jgi:3-oxoacyl-[acyl-carrier-protein] synthase-3
VVASQIEAGAIDAGLVVAAEDGRALIDATVGELLRRDAVGKNELKSAFASLTIGGGAAAMVLARTELAPHASELLGATSRAATEHHALCHGDHVGTGGMWMETDSEALMHAGNALARSTFDDFLSELEWGRGGVERVVTHQVGVAHRKLLLESLQLDPGIDFPTVETFGNIGSVSLPLTLSIARERGFIQPGQRVAMLGIGSGLQCTMLGLRN